MQKYKLLSGKSDCLYKVLQLEYTPDGKIIVAIMKSVEQKENGVKERPKYKTCNLDTETGYLSNIKEYDSKPSMNHQGTVLHRLHAVALDDSGRFVAVLSHRDRTIHILDIDSENCVSQIWQEKNPCSIVFTTGALINKYEDLSLHFTCSVCSPDCSQISVGTEDGNVCVWETSSLIQEFIN